MSRPSALRLVVAAIAAVGLACESSGGADTRVTRASAAPTANDTDATGGGTRPRDQGGPATSTTAAATPTSSGPAGGNGLPGAGGPGAGDPYYPGAGNEGVDLADISLALTWAPGRSPDDARLDGVATLQGRTSRQLASFNLDLLGLEVTAVEVDGRAATFAHHEGELTVTPAELLRADTTFTATVHYGGRPRPVDDGTGLSTDVGWITTSWGSYVVSEPTGAATWFPSNNHPSDKAVLHLAVTVPDGLDVAATGRLAGVVAGPAPATKTWRFESRDPVASYLVSVATGHFVTDTTTAAGIEVRNVYTTTAVDQGRVAFRRTPDMIATFAELFGPFPFDVYGGLVVGEFLGYAIENQTLSMFGLETVTSGQGGGEAVVAHELAHQWFGDSVSVARWSDIWLNEGWATYAEHLWRAHVDPTYDVDAAMNRLAASGAGAWGPPASPGREGLFSPAVYQRGALTLHALRRTIGDDAFFALAKAWTTNFRGRSASTADFIALASQVSGRDVSGLLSAWLFDQRMPALPR